MPGLARASSSRSRRVVAWLAWRKPANSSGRVMIIDSELRRMAGGRRIVHSVVKRETGCRPRIWLGAPFSRCSSHIRDRVLSHRGRWNRQPSVSGGTTMSRLDAVAVVQAFHDNLNDRNVNALLDLATDHVRIGGPRGSGEGKYLLEEWVGRASITMTPKRWFRAGDVVV